MLPRRGLVVKRISMDVSQSVEGRRLNQLYHVFSFNPNSKEREKPRLAWKQPSLSRKPHRAVGQNGVDAAHAVDDLGNSHIHHQARQPQRFAPSNLELRLHQIQHGFNG